MNSETAWVVALALFVAAWVVTTVTTPLVMRFAAWIGAVNRIGSRRMHRGPIPLMGGLSVAAPFLGLCLGLALVLWLREAMPIWVTDRITLPRGVIGLLAAVRHEFGPLAVASALVLILGAVDDVYHLKPLVKLFFQSVAAVLVLAAGYMVSEFQLPLLGTIHLSREVGFAVGLLWIVGLTNAFNMMDGVDGLACGIALIAAVSFAILAAIQSNLFVLLLSALLAGSLAAFLRYNFPPGRAFLGDAGSLFLGFSMATIALMGKHKGQASLLLGTPVLILSLPMIEMALSVARRYLRGQPVFGADARHTHHRLFKRGLSGRRTVFFLYGVCGLLAVAGLLLAIAPSSHTVIAISAMFYGIALLMIVWAGGYVRGPRTILARLSRRPANKLLGALAEYGARALSTNGGLDAGEQICSLFCRHAGLASLEIRLADGTVLHSDGNRFGSETGTVVEFDAELPNQGHAFVRMAFDRKVNDLEQQDVTAAIARMLESASIRRPVDESLATKSEILGLGCNLLDYGAVLNVVRQWRETHAGRSRYIIALNPHSVMMGRRNNMVRHAMAGAAMALPDGVGMIWAANMLGYSHKGRCTGPTLMLNLCDWGRQHRFRHFFYGGAEGVVEELVQRLQSAYPGLEVAGTCTPPFRELTPEEDGDVCRQINASAADIVWVGLGAPKQERWMAEHEDRLDVPVLIGVGAAFDYHSGRVKWAPAWVRGIGMEWAYRLIQEPRRLWRRNLDSPLFLFHVLFQKLRPPAFREGRGTSMPATVEKDAEGRE
jgi:N-acetylglucosaminyldiphosphoundecaprenol N-acetyl-beta-D-mannosaminyltransferase